MEQFVEVPPRNRQRGSGLSGGELLRAELLQHMANQRSRQAVRQLVLPATFFSLVDNDNSLGALPPNPRSLTHSDTD
jgi:hypothetical protein